MIKIKKNFFRNFMIKKVYHIILLIIFSSFIHYLFSFKEFIILIYNIIIFIEFKRITEKGNIYFIINILPNFLYLIYIIYNIKIIYLWLKGSIIYFGILIMIEKFFPTFKNPIHYDTRNIIGFIIIPILFSNIYISLIFYDIIFFNINFDNFYNLLFL
jgi:hypothetical protein